MKPASGLVAAGFMPPASRAPSNFRLIPRAGALGYYMPPPFGGLGLAERERKQSQTFYTLGIRAPNLRPMLQEPISFIPSGRVAQAPDGPPRGHSRVRAFPLAGSPALGGRL